MPAVYTCRTCVKSGFTPLTTLSVYVLSAIWGVIHLDPVAAIRSGPVPSSKVATPPLVAQYKVVPWGQVKDVLPAIRLPVGRGKAVTPAVAMASDPDAPLTTSSMLNATSLLVHVAMTSSPGSGTAGAKTMFRVGVGGTGTGKVIGSDRVSALSTPLLDTVVIPAR